MKNAPAGGAFGNPGMDRLNGLVSSVSAFISPAAQTEIAARIMAAPASAPSQTA